MKNESAAPALPAAESTEEVSLTDKPHLRVAVSLKARAAEIFTRIKEILDEVTTMENTLVGEVRGTDIKPPQTFSLVGCLDYIEEILNWTRSRLQTINRNLGK